MSLMPPKIVGMYRLKNEERWISKSIESLKGICSEIVVLDESTDRTVEILKTFDEVVNIFHQENIEFDEVRDRNKLLRMALERNPDYILAMDGDEILLPNSQNILLDEIKNNSDVNVFEFQSLFIWDKPNQYRFDGVYKTTWHKRLLRIKSQPTNLSFDDTPYPYNLHSGLLPHNSVGFDTPFQSRVLILHYGYYDEKLRQTKFDTYTKKDPNNTEFDGYKHIISDNSKLAGSHGMEFSILPEGMYVPNFENSENFSEINTQYDNSQTINELHLSGLKSYIQEIFKDNKRIMEEKENVIIGLQNSLEETKSHLEQVITSKDKIINGLESSVEEQKKYLENVIIDKDKIINGLESSIFEEKARLENTIKDYREQIRQIRQNKIMQILSIIDKIRGKN